MSDDRRPTNLDWKHTDWPASFTREDVIAAYNDYHRTNDESLSWAWEVVEEMMREGDLDEAWSLTLDLVAAAPDPASLGVFAAGPLEDLLRSRGPMLIDRIEAEAPGSSRLREAIAGVWIGPEHVGQDVFDRLRAVAESNPGNWPLGESGIPEVAERLLASDRIEDRQWGARQLHSVPDTPARRALLLDLLHSGDEPMRESASQRSHIPRSQPTARPAGRGQRSPRSQRRAHARLERELVGALRERRCAWPCS